MKVVPIHGCLVLGIPFTHNFETTCIHIINKVPLLSPNTRTYVVGEARFT